MAFSAVLGASLALIVLVTPADRAGSPLFDELMRPIEERFNLATLSSNELLGGDPTVNTPSNDRAVYPRFIIRFEDSATAAEALRSFRENRTRGRELFDAWAETEERFKGFRLEGLTPSGEAVISYRGDESANDSNRIRQLTRQLLDAPFVIYADSSQFVGPAG
ncbi:MAG: hypothetical protein CMK07_15825 [Ponticaulis sp.]|nr:hypothetical protein [Ponticaulis sp.]